MQKFLTSNWIRYVRRLIVSIFHQGTFNEQIAEKVQVDERSKYRSVVRKKCGVVPTATTRYTNMPKVEVRELVLCKFTFRCVIEKANCKRCSRYQAWTIAPHAVVPFIIFHRTRYRASSFAIRTGVHRSSRHTSAKFTGGPLFEQEEIENYYFPSFSLCAKTVRTHDITSQITEIAKKEKKKKKNIDRAIFFQSTSSFSISSISKSLSTGSIPWHSINQTNF